MGDLVLTEVFADFKAPAGGTSGADEGKEWIEIYNASDRPIELEGLRIDHSRIDGSKLASHFMAAVTIAPGQYLTLGNATSDLLPAYVDYGYSNDLGDLFNSDGGKLSLNCGTSEIDSATYEEIKEGKSRQLTGATFPDYTLNDVPANWCEAALAEFDPANFGTPGGESDCQPVVQGACNDNGTMRPTVSPQPGELVITEAMPQPAGDDTKQEWFEVKALADFDLNGLGLDRAGDTTVNPNLVESPDCLHVTAGEYVIFVNSEDMALNGGLPAASIRGTFKFSLVNGTVAAPGDIQILSGGNVIDAVSWSDSNASVSLNLDPDLEDATANDNLSNYCDGTAPYGAGGAGTPGAVNTQCVLLPPAGQCSDTGTNRAIVKPAAGQLVITEFLANPAPPPAADGTTDADKEWFEIANTGATAFDLNELGIGRLGVTAVPIASADCISVAPGALALFARSKDPLKNGGMDNVDVTFAFSLVDSGVNRSIQIFDGVTELDSLTYTATSSAASGLSIQLDPDNFTSAANDLANVTAGVYCQGVTPYGDLTNKGTPKAANAQCP
ncbi:MAG: lamin tail domain-containing protein [Kofleriaceae bacterium]